MGATLSIRILHYMFISVLRRRNVCETMIMIRKYDQAFHIPCYEHGWAITDQEAPSIAF